MVQLNYHVIATDAQMHRTIAQRVLAEMLQRLAVHIVAGHHIKVRDVQHRHHAALPAIVDRLSIRALLLVAPK